MAPDSARQQQRLQERKAKLQRRTRVVGRVAAATEAALTETRATMYEKTSAALLEMMGNKGMPGLNSLDAIMKQLQASDAFAFQQMIKKVMAAAVADSAMPEASRRDGVHSEEDYARAQEQHAEDWTSVMRWAKKRALARADEVTNSFLPAAPTRPCRCVHCPGGGGSGVPRSQLPVLGLVGASRLSRARCGGRWRHLTCTCTGRLPRSPSPGCRCVICMMP
jgi:hypothetical protein